MNPKDFDHRHTYSETVENPEPTPKYKEGDWLYGNNGERKEFAGRVRDISDWGGEIQYALVDNESDYQVDVREWYYEKDLSRLSLLDRVRRIEDLLRISDE